jgi:pimeloyl-ACP methyl ester carboxylesterase
MQINAGNTRIEVDDQGPTSGEPLLLIMGLGMQLTAWPEPLVKLLLARGFRVIRMDNRDAGLSQGFDHLGMPHLAWAGLRYTLHLKVQAPYSLADMAGDALGVLDALGLPRAHVCGASLGGMVAQHLAASHPGRVASLTLMMTTSGARHLPQPGMRVRAALLSRPASAAPADVVAHLMRVLAVIGSPAFVASPEEQSRRLHAMVTRAWRPDGTARQLAAVLADGDRSALLPRITAPTLVIHGQDDPLVPAAAGIDLASRIPGATSDLVPGMGHDLPAALLGRFADGIRANASRAGRSRG